MALILQYKKGRLDRTMKKLSQELICSLLVLGICISFALSLPLAMATTEPGAVPSIAGEGDFFRDDFGDYSINTTWTQVPKTGSISEAWGGYLQLYSTGCDWWGINNLLVDVGCNAPYAYVDMPATDFVMTTRNLNAGNMEAGQAGLILYLNEDNVVLFGGAKGGYGIGVSVEGISANRVWNAGIASSGTVTNQYLRVRKESGTYYFDYSADGASWTTLTSRTEAFFEFTPAKVGLFEKNWNGAYEAQFDYFCLTNANTYAGIYSNNVAAVVIPIVVIIAILCIVWVAIRQKNKNSPTRSPITSPARPQGQVPGPIIYYPSVSSTFQQPFPLKPLVQGESKKIRVDARCCSACGTQMDPAQRFCHKCGLDTEETP